MIKYFKDASIVKIFLLFDIIGKNGVLNLLSSCSGSFKIGKKKFRRII